MLCPFSEDVAGPTVDGGAGRLVVDERNVERKETMGGICLWWHAAVRAGADA